MNSIDVYSDPAVNADFHGGSATISGLNFVGDTRADVPSPTDILFVIDTPYANDAGPIKVDVTITYAHPSGDVNTFGPYVLNLSGSGEVSFSLFGIDTGSNMQNALVPDLGGVFAADIAVHPGSSGDVQIDYVLVRVLSEDGYTPFGPAMDASLGDVYQAFSGD